MEELGRGAYGTVMKAVSNETKEIFAVKIVDKKVSDSYEMVPARLYS